MSTSGYVKIDGSTAATGTVTWTYPINPPPQPHPCPCCGRCPTCGRGGYAYPYPWWPYYPPVSVPFVQWPEITTAPYTVTWSNTQGEGGTWTVVGNNGEATGGDGL